VNLQAFHVLNPHFELWNSDSDVQGWTKVGNGTIAKVSGFMGNACKFTSPANGETYIYQDVDADGYQQLTFVVFLKTRGNFTIGIDNGAGYTKREVTVLSTSVTYDKYMLVAITSPIDETPTNVRLAIWPQKATSDVSEIQIEAVELIQGAL
jgi:hypothetical protein